MIKINYLNKIVVDEFREIFGEEFTPITVIGSYGDTCDVELNENVLVMSSNAQVILFYHGSFVRLRNCDFLNVEIQ